MKIPVWVLSTCLPEEGEPCRPQVFADEAAARAAFDANMREEWNSNAPEDQQGTRLDYPGDPEQAVRLIREAAGREWGTWELTRARGRGRVRAASRLNQPHLAEPVRPTPRADQQNCTSVYETRPKS